MTVTPQGQLYLCKTKLENDYKNQLTFSNLSAQLTYFNSTIQHTFDNYTYIKKDNVVQVGKNIDEIIDCNYLFYKNTGFTNKYYFCFITNMEYVNENCTRITFETDCYQTWMFNLSYKKCFVEREHVNSDGYGEHTIPENLEYGELTCAYSSVFSSIGTSHVVMASNINPSTLSNVGGGEYGGIYSGVTYYVFQNNTSLNNALIRMAENGKIDGIVGLFYLPDWITGYNTATFDSNGVAPVPKNSESSENTGIAIPLHPTQIDGYTPKNKKCFIFPYCQYTLSNNSGGAITYRLEDFKNTGDNTGNIKIVGSCCIGGSIRAYPTNYKLQDLLLADDNNEYGLTLGKFPVCSYAVDSYTNWLTQNSMNIGLSTASNTLNIASSLITGNINEGVSGIFGIANTLSEIYQHQFVPTQAEGNINSGDITFSDGKLTFTGYFNTIKNEYVKIIDEYFSAYGYKVNSFKIPNITGRRNWNYIKTIECNVEGDIPQTDLQIIRNMFNNGVTLWHNTTTMLDYSSNNDII